MKFDEFTGQVQNRLELATQGESVRASRAMLTTLGEQLSADAAQDLADHLPMEIDQFPLDVEHGQELSYQEFVDSVAEYEHEDAPDAHYDAQVFIAYLDEFVPEEVMGQIRADLPSAFDKLFAVADRQEAQG